MAKKRLFIGTFTSVSGMEMVRETVESLGILGKWVEKENIHFTYRFLGNVKEENVSQIGRALKGKLKGLKAPTVEYRGLGVFPNFKFPKVLWIGVESKVVENLKRKVDQALLPFGFPLEQNFKPHVTLLRINKLRHAIKFKSYLFQMKDYHFDRKVERKVYLIESKLTREGPIYSVLEEVILD